MKNIFKSLIICTVLALLTVGSSNVWAGNRDRSGQSGASHLLIDPWARSNGMANAGIAEAITNTRDRMKLIIDTLVRFFMIVYSFLIRNVMWFTFTSSDLLYHTE